ncbi:MAG: hypothetical protein ABIP78_06625 [Pyrinomonadaceae bacterium]
MTKLLRSKAGYAAAGLYLLVTLPFIVAMAVTFMVRYYNDNQPVPFEALGIAGVFLTLPWSIAATLLGLIAQGQGMQVGRLVLIICLIIGAMINASIFYLLAYGVSKAFNYRRESGNPKV